MIAAVGRRETAVGRETADGNRDDGRDPFRSARPPDRPTGRKPPHQSVVVPSAIPGGPVHAIQVLLVYDNRPGGRLRCLLPSHLPSAFSSPYDQPNRPKSYLPRRPAGRSRCHLPFAICLRHPSRPPPSSFLLPPSSFLLPPAQSRCILVPTTRGL